MRCAGHRSTLRFSGLYDYSAGKAAFRLLFLLLHGVQEGDGEPDVGLLAGRGKEGRYVFGLEACQGAAHLGDHEVLVGMPGSIVEEFIHIGLDGSHTALHDGDGIALSLDASPLMHLCTEALQRLLGNPAGMNALQIGTENEYVGAGYPLQPVGRNAPGNGWCGNGKELAGDFLIAEGRLHIDTRHTAEAACILKDIGPTAA